MENRPLSIFLTAQLTLFFSALLLSSSARAADEPTIGEADDSFGQVVEQSVERRQIDEAAIDDEDFEITLYAGILSIEDFGVGSLAGARFAYHVSESLFVEASVGLSEAEETSFERLSGNVQLLTADQRDYNFYNISLGYNLLGETFLGDSYAFNSALYVIGGIGSTDFAGASEFTTNFGAGYRFLLSDTFAAHVDVRDHIFDVDLLGEVKTTHNIEISLGISIFF